MATSRGSSIFTGGNWSARRKPVMLGRAKLDNILLTFDQGKFNLITTRSRNRTIVTVVRDTCTSTVPPALRMLTLGCFTRVNQAQTQARGGSHKENKQNNLVRIRTLTVGNMADNDIAALLVAWLTLYILRRRRKTRLRMRARLRDIIFGERNKEIITILCIHLAKLNLSFDALEVWRKFVTEPDTYEQLRRPSHEKFISVYSAILLFVSYTLALASPRFTRQKAVKQAVE